MVRTHAISSIPRRCFSPGDDLPGGAALGSRANQYSSALGSAPTYYEVFAGEPFGFGNKSMGKFGLGKIQLALTRSDPL